MDELDQQENESFSEWAGRVVPIITNFVDSFLDIIKPYLNAFFDAMKKLYDWIYSLYLKDGAPYGETPEGMQRWFEQRIREDQARQEVEWAEQRRRDLEEMRELGREMGRRSLSPGGFN